MAEFDSIRQLPHSQEAEQALLGAVLLDPEKFNEIVFLKPEYFYEEQHQQIYTAMLEMYNTNRSIEIVNLVDALTRLGLFNDGNAYKYIKLLCDTATDNLNAAECAGIIRDKAMLRALIETLRELSEEAYSEVGGADAIIAEAERRIFSIAENKFDLSFDRIRDVLRDNLSLLEQLSDNPDLLSGVKTQFEGLDRVLVGLGKGDLVLVGARPGMGKTSFVMNIAANFAKATKEKVAVFSLEMSSEQLVNRMLSSEALIDNNALRTGKLSTEEWKRIAAAASLLSETQIYIDDTPGVTVNLMKAKLRRLKDVKLVIIDYLQLMQSEHHTDNRVQEVAEMTRALKLLAKEFECPIILCSQLSRSNEARSDKRPMLSDLRDSGAIEQDADIVISLYRNDYYSKEEDAASGEAIVAECLVAKNRHGPTGTVNLIWQGKNFRFYTPEDKYDHVG